jgi:transposase
MMALFGGPMLRVEAVMEIRILHRQGMSIRGIARELGLARKTVRRCLRDGSGVPPRYGPRPERPSKLDPHKEYLRRRVAEAHPRWIPATVLLAEIRGRGYDGGISILKDHLRPLKPRPQPEPLVRFETAPGEQMQADWATLRRGRDRLSAFIATLGHSRAAYVEFVADERLETLLACHEHAFASFGGVPREVLYGNMKAVVLERDAYGPAPVPPHLLGLRPPPRLPAAAVPAAPGQDQGQGRALRRLPQGQLLRAAGQPAAGRRHRGRRRHRQPGVPALARRGGQRPGARHHRPHPGGGAGRGASAPAAAARALAGADVAHAGGRGAPPGA